MHLPEPEEVEEEVYSWLFLRFRIAPAVEVLRENPREPDEMDTDHWAEGLSHVVDEEGNPHYMSTSEYREMTGEKKVSFTMGTHIDWDYVKKMDPKRVDMPVIFVTWEVDGKLGGMPIDGHHRIARKKLDKEERFKAYLLTPEESERLYTEQIRTITKDTIKT